MASQFGQYLHLALFDVVAILYAIDIAWKKVLLYKSSLVVHSFPSISREPELEKGKKFNTDFPEE